MRAVQLSDVGRDPQLASAVRPEPGDGEVLVGVRACGICGSDLHIIDGTIATSAMPMTLGHEAAGVVESWGAGVDDLNGGERVLINPIITCGDCESCRSGQENLCPHNKVLGVDLPGAHADYVVVPRRNVYLLPDGLDFPTAAIMADAVAGPYRAIKRSGLVPGQSAVIYGLGGLGLHAAILLDQVFGVRVFGVDNNEVALSRAGSFGVTEVFDGRDPRVSAAIRESTGGVDAAFDFVGLPQVTEQALRSVRPGGRVVVMGLTQAKLDLALREDFFVAKELQLLGAYGYGSQDLRELIDLLARGELVIDGTITHVFDLDDYAAGLEALRSREDPPIRVVITNNE